MNFVLGQRVTWLSNFLSSLESLSQVYGGSSFPEEILTVVQFLQS